MSSIWQVRRSATDTKLAGVCAGLAAHWGVDPVLVRVACALLALTGGIGVVLYLAGWLLVPQEGQYRSVADDLLGGSARRWPREIWVTLVVVACVASFTLFSPVSPFGMGPAVVLVAVWYFGFYRRRASRVGPGSAAPDPDPYVALPPVGRPGPATPFTEAAAAWQARVYQVRSGQAVQPGRPAASLPYPSPSYPSPSYPPPAYAPYVASPVDEHAAFLAEPDPVGLYAEPPAQPTPPLVRPGRTLAARRLRLVTLLALGLTFGGLGLADRQGLSVPPTAYAGSALLVVGLALVAATWLGRARGLLPLGVLLAGAALVTATGLSGAVTAPVRHPDDFGSRQVAYRTAADLPSTPDRLVAGDLTADLSGLSTTTDVTYRARVDNGELVVRVPPGTGVLLRYDVGWGEVRAFDRSLAEGRRLQAVEHLVPAAAGQPTLTLELSMKRGQLEVRS